MAPNESKIERCIVGSAEVWVQFQSEKDIPEPSDVSVEIVEFNGKTVTPHKIQTTVQDKKTRSLLVKTGTLNGEVMVHIARKADQVVLLDRALKVGQIVDFPTIALNDETRRTTSAAEDAVSYALLTESINGGATGSTPQARTGSSETGGAQLIGQTLRDVLGWKVRDDDPKGFSGALTASFAISEVEGHTEWTYTPRTYAVQTDLNGGITGAQASLYKRAQEALAQSLPLLDGLYPLDPDADVEDIAAVKAVLRKQLDELVAELGAPGGPGITRVESYFKLLLAGAGSTYENKGQLLDPEPDDLKGTLGRLRDMLGLSFADNLVNSVEDEQDLTNYRILADYVTALAQSWLSNRQFFGLDSKRPFLGTQLVPLSRQLSVIAESVDELRFALDSVFIGAAERQTLKLKFGIGDEPMYAEDFLGWIQDFVTNEAPGYVQDGGKFGIGNSLVPFASKLQSMTDAMKSSPGLPPGFSSVRVQRSIKSLSDELNGLVTLATPLTRDPAIVPAAAQLRATVSAQRLAALQGVLFFSAQNMTQSTTLLNLSDALVTIKNPKPGRVTFFEPFIPKGGGLVASLQPRSGMPVQITLTSLPTSCEEIKFESKFADGTIATTATVSLLKA